MNRALNIDFLDERYDTIIGQEDAQGRIVMGPKNEFYAKAGGGKPISAIPDYLSGPHVTLFGPPDDPKLSINAMNAFHRKLKDEPVVVTELLANSKYSPKWGADDEDSKTPLRRDLISAGVNLTGCFDGDLSFVDPKTKKSYQLEKDHLSHPIKRFPGLALPCSFLFYRDEPLPLHLYDFALHLFKNWQHNDALCFYVPKLENEEEASYIRLMIETAEKLIQKNHPAYKIGSIRLLIVLENPRAIFRVNEIMDNLYPYFAGASLGWHDYLASTARVFKEDGNYRIPVKADPNIVIKYIKASHDLLSEVVGSRGGIKIGGMYGILPMDNELSGDSFQITIKGFIKDVVTQMKRNLSGFWVAHPDFVRLGLAIVEAWRLHEKKDSSKLDRLVTSLLVKKDQIEILKFIHGPDLTGLKVESPLYPRALLVADIAESDFIHNNDPEEIRYNVFQTLQYLTDWLSGNGCVALPSQIAGIPVRVMDDLATAERSRWEVWHEIRHGRFKLEDFLKIAHEEMLFIRKEKSDGKKIVQVKWDERSEKWYPIAFNLMIQLMTKREPVEFATELLMPFTIDSIRDDSDSWTTLSKMDPKKYGIDPYIERFNAYFSVCGSLKFASELAQNISLDLIKAESIVKNFNLQGILDSASFHGDIGENKKTLDEVAAKEQARVLIDSEANKENLRKLGSEYLEKFGFKYLISAHGKSAEEILSNLQTRLRNTREQEMDHARIALWEISLKRLKLLKDKNLETQIEALRLKHKVPGAMISILSGTGSVQTLCCGSRDELDPVRTDTNAIHENTFFELASLSKTLGACFSIEYFLKKSIPLTTSVNSLFEKTESNFRLSSNDVLLKHLMNHQALNMHYVFGIPLKDAMPNVKELLSGNEKYNYSPIEVHAEPGTVFQYSGGGFLVLEHLIESLEKKSIQELTKPFLKNLDLENLSFEQKDLPGVEYANPKTRKMFPAFAAGAVGTSTAYAKFLQKLGNAFHQKTATSPISHDTAVLMLNPKDTASQRFMGVNIGLGVFIAEALSNRFAIHQGANDGFRCLSLYCYQGPDTGKGLVILANADVNGVFFVAEAAQLILESLKIVGIDFESFKTEFDPSKIPEEERVNIGYKKLIFDAFQPDLPEEILIKGAPDPLARFNLAVGAKIGEVSNQRFARAENLLSTYLPIFDPELYGLQGKTMDSWESVRHNFKPKDDPRDTFVFELKKPSRIAYVSLSTAFHAGNHAPVVSLEGLEVNSGEWKVILPKTSIAGHALKKIRLPENKTIFKTIRASMYPDGGFSRLGLYDETLPETDQKDFLPIDQSTSVVFKEGIPLPKKSLTPKFKTNPEWIQKNWDGLKKGQEFDIANAAYSGKIIRATNEHFGPAIQVISPYPPLNMFDGAESARSRIKNHFEEIVIELGKPAKLHRIEIDFTYFINNNPNELSVDALVKGNWISIVPKTEVKAYAGNTIEFKIAQTEMIEQLKITTFPDGGMNRIRAFTRT
jgi:malate synthase